VDTLASQPASQGPDGNPHFEGSPDEGEVAVPLSDPLDQRRPHRADAARNFDAILAAARAGFTDSGTEASLEIARRAGVGPATLYRNFPAREDLIEAVYVAEVDSLCQDAVRLAETEKPWPALVAWIRHFVTYMATKRVLLDASASKNRFATGTTRWCPPLPSTMNSLRSTTWHVTHPSETVDLGALRVI
jgi:AcrR family transcriptional regulator